MIVESISGGGANGPITALKISAVQNANLSFSPTSEEPFTVTGGGNDAEFHITKKIVSVTVSNLVGNFAVGDLIEENNNKAIVLAISGSSPTRLAVYQGSAVVSADNWDYGNGNSFQIATVSADTTKTYDTYQTIDLGLDGIFNFDNYNADGTAKDDQKIKLDTSNVFLQTDIFYFPPKEVEAAKQAMMSPNGMPHIYTQFLNVKSSLSDDNLASSYGEAKPQSINRLLGLSNSVVRNIYWMVQNSGSGTQNREELPYHGKVKFNPLLNKYHSRSSLAMDGIRYNFNINSVPVYSNEIRTDLRAWNELNKCRSNYYINRGLYQGWNQCRQLDNSAAISNAAPSKQPGFCSMDNRLIPTKKYELNDRKSAISNQGYGGVDQHCLRGMGHYMGVSFQLHKMNTMGNGVAIGSTPVDMNLTWYDTYNPYYSGKGELSIFSEVERFLVFKNGKAYVQSASY